MTERARQWTVTASAALVVLAAIVAWGGYLHARATPHWVQTPPGAMTATAPDGGMPLRLVSLTTTQLLVTDAAEPNAAPAGALWVIAVIEYEPPDEGSSCLLRLLAADGRRWDPVDSSGYTGSRELASGCLAKKGDQRTPRSELIFLIPEDEVTSIAGLGHGTTAYRGPAPFPVLTPPR